MYYPLFIIALLIFSALGASYKGISYQDLKTLESKIKVKVNYNENPNPKDFFTNTDLTKYSELGPIKNLRGLWHGKYNLDKESIVWINPNLKTSYIHKLIAFGPYNIYLRLNTVSNSLKDKLSRIEIAQADINYDPVNIEHLDKDKQINYWTKAITKEWVEVIRGKIFRVNDNELLTIFQTTVYEKKTPIYAFSGEATLRKTLESK